MSKKNEHYLCADLVNVMIHSVDGRVSEGIANLEEINPRGASIHFEEAVREGARIELFCASCNLRGKVELCEFVETGYDVSMKFEKRGYWSRSKFEPKHLLSLAALRKLASAPVGHAPHSPIRKPAKKRRTRFQEALATGRSAGV